MKPGQIWNLPTPERDEETRTFEDAALGSVTLTMRRLTYLEEGALSGRNRELAREWLEPKKGQTEPNRYPTPDGGITLNAVMLESLLRLEMMQPPGEDRWTWEDLLGLSIKRPELYGEISEWAIGFLPGVERGNALRAGGISSAPPVSPDTDTQGSNSGSVPSNGHSTNGSGSSAGLLAPVVTVTA